MALIVKRGFIQDKFNIVIVPKEVFNIFLEKHLQRKTKEWKAFTVITLFDIQSSTWTEKPAMKETIGVVLSTLKKSPIITLPKTRKTPDFRLPLLAPKSWKVREFDPVTRRFSTEPIDGDLVVTIEKYAGTERRDFLIAFEEKERLSLGEKIKLSYYFRKYPGNKLLLYFITHVHVGARK
ncbi:MAG: hypothetical protein AABX13_05720 [Nanoarchaeota archaeon]